MTSNVVTANEDFPSQRHEKPDSVSKAAPEDASTPSHRHQSEDKGHYIPQEILAVIVDTSLHMEMHHATGKDLPEICECGSEEAIFDYTLPTSNWNTEQRASFENYENYIDQVLAFQSTCRATRAKALYVVQQHFQQTDTRLKELLSPCMDCTDRRDELIDQWEQYRARHGPRGRRNDDFRAYFKDIFHKYCNLSHRLRAVLLPHVVLAALLE